MVNKILFCATVDSHFKAFHIPYLRWFKEKGWEVHLAASGNLELPYVDKKFTIPIQRSPFHKMNFSAFKNLKSIIDENQYKMIHCHTPMGGVLTRLAAKEARKNVTKVLYTAHGFHFCKGAPFINWLIYYPIEKILSNYTDCLITINKEDFHLATAHKFKAKSIKQIHGVGVDTETFKPLKKIEQQELRKSLGYKPNDFLLFYAAEFNKNKNQQLLIKALSLLKDEIPNAKLLLAGSGPLLQECKMLASKLRISGMVDFLGYQDNIEFFLKVSDIAVGSSLREGLPVNIMEAMSCELPVIATNNRGHRELIKHNKTGWIVEQNAEDFAYKIKILAKDRDLRFEFGENGRRVILAWYSIQKVLEEKKIIYKSYMGEMEDILWGIH
ncbi:MAG: glycosyltransferase family 4 protein [Bacillota bacterium]|nr:glycosyltransferase family 4 protein [Bacillota bacterium]